MTAPMTPVPEPTAELDFAPVETVQTIAKPGYLTTEFWLTLAVVIAATVLRAMDSIDQAAWMAAAGIATGGYSVSRGLAKL